MLGYVPEADLPSITAAASVFAYPSFYEGFGFPIAQAMAAGVPVVTSNISSMPEVVGDGGVLVDPRSAGELSSALDRLLTSRTLRESLGMKGRELARKYHVEELGGAFRRVLHTLGLEANSQLVADNPTTRLEERRIQEAARQGSADV